MTASSGLNKEILRLSLPSILANITIPLVGMVDTAIAGHLPTVGAATPASFIGAISVGAMLFNLLYWSFFFLRTGTGGITAQAFGRSDMGECAAILGRSLTLALAVAGVTLLLQRPFVDAVLYALDGTPQVESLAREYFFIRIWAAPATLSLMAFSGWFVGMQDSMSSMWKDLVVNMVNVVASWLLCFGIGNWQGMGFPGVALGTVIAQYSGLLYCIAVCLVKYRKKVFSRFSRSRLASLLRGSELRKYLSLNADLLVRSICFIGVYMGYTIIATGYGDTVLACSSIMMQLLMLFSYFTDGFAYAGEALSGRFIGECSRKLFSLTVKYVFIWSMAIAFLFIGVYVAAGVPLLRLMTDDKALVDSCREFLPWLMIMPPVGCAAFTWDGIYLGAAQARAMRNAMLGATILFFVVWFLCRWTIDPQGADALHVLLGAYFTHLIFRTVLLTVCYRSLYSVFPAAQQEASEVQDGGSDFQNGAAS